MVRIKYSIFAFTITLISGLFGASRVWAQTGADPFREQWSYSVADVYRAWNYTGRLEDVVVAVIDNGFDYTHPDIAPNLWLNKKEIPDNGIDDDNNKYIDDVYGWNFIDGTNNPLPDVAEISDTDLIHHGTVVAGIIGAVGNNGRDGSGIARNVKLMNLKVVDNVGSGLLKTVVEAIYYAVDNGAKIINMSMVGSGEAPEVRKAIHYAYGRGVTVVAAAGNNITDLNTAPAFPVCSDIGDPFTSVIGVTAVDQSRRLATFSNIGATCVDITAPGVNIGGPMRYAPSEGHTLSYQTGWNGTSFAAPFISAGAALIRGIQPTWNPDQITRTLFSTVHHTAATDERAYREAYGKGLIQIGAAVETAATGQVPDPRIFVTGDKDTAFVAPRRLVLSGNSSDMVYQMLGENKEILKSSIIKDAEAVTSFRDSNGNAYYALIKPKNKTEKYVSIYDYNWTRRFRWSFEVRGKNYEILAADIMGDENKEIILMATSAGREELRVFYMDGTVMGDLSQNTTHLGATGSVGRNLANEGDELLYAYRSSASSVVITRITKDQGREIVNQPVLRSLGSVSYLYDKELDQEFIVIGSGVGTAPQVNVFTRAGELAYTFRPYDLSFRGGVKVLSMIYGDAGVERIITVPKQGIYTLRIFDYSGAMFEDMAVDQVLTKGKDVRATVAPF